MKNVFFYIFRISYQEIPRNMLLVDIKL